MCLFNYEEDQSGKYLVYVSKKEDKLDISAIRLLSEGHIKEIVPVDFVPVDQGIYMKYHITGLVPLKDCLSGVIKRERILSIIESMADILLLSEKSGIRTSLFVLDPSRIYMEPKTEKLFLLLLPVIREGESPEIFFKKLVFNIQYDQTEDCSYVTKLFNLFANESQFSLDVLKRQLSALRGMVRKKSQKLDVQGEMKSEPVRKREDDHIENIIKSRNTAVKRHFKSDPEKQYYLDILFSESRAEKEEKERKWKFSDKVNQNEKREKWNFLKKDESTDETILLDEEGEGPHLRYILLRERTGERFIIQGEISRIGRNPVDTDITISGNPGIGRVHAIFHLYNGRIFIEDNGSKNKTYVDDKQVKPEDGMRLLLSGSKIRFADEVFEFRICR